MSKRGDKVKYSKNEEDMRETLSQMEKLADEKLANQKVFTPILLTVVTSIIAFLFVQNLGDDKQTVQIYLMVFSYALFCFVMLIIALFGRSDYDAKVRKTKEQFQPHRLSTYCYLSDENYLSVLKRYAGRELTHVECLSANCIKQKINEYVFKKDYLNIVLVIILVGVLILAFICMLGVFVLPELPQYGGGTV